MTIEHELDCIEQHKYKAKMEQVDQDATFLFQKSRSKLEGETKGCEVAKKKLRNMLLQNIRLRLSKRSKGKMSLT